MVADDARQIGGVVHLLSVDAEHHVAGQQTGLSAGEPLSTVGDERAGGFVEAEVLRQIGVEALDGYAQAAAGHLCRSAVADPSPFITPMGIANEIPMKPPERE